MTTIFKKIIQKEIKADIVYEDESVLAFNDISPQAPTHILIIPKKEIPTLNDISENDKELIGHMFIVASKIARKFNINEEDH